jgi:predicted ATPase
VPIERLTVRGYRSIHHVDLELSPVNVIAGPNGVGKSNLYKSLHLLVQAVAGRFGRTVAREGGMNSVLWAGPDLKLPRRMSLGIAMDGFRYEFVSGLVATSPDERCKTEFFADPDIKEEHFSYEQGRSKVKFFERKNSFAWIRDGEGNKIDYTMEILDSQTMMETLSDPHLYPEVFVFRQQLAATRFYHDFPTGPDSPARSPQVATFTSLIDVDGTDLASALKSIEERGDAHQLHTFFKALFPGNQLVVRRMEGTNRLAIEMEIPKLNRRLSAEEFSDGTLRFLYLLAVLLSLKESPLIALNEPERSLHPDAIGPLAELILLASRRSQIWLVTHSNQLRDALAGKPGVANIDLAMRDGKTICSVS